MEKNNSNDFSFDKLSQTANGDQAFVNEMLQLFLDRTPGMITEMKDACLNNDFQKIARLAHQLKPSIDMVGNEKMGKLIVEINNTAKNKSSGNKNLKLIDEFNKQAESIFNLISKKLKNPG
jgi:HPt (histidine-containing phosphotransfer) domain-containing protein